MGRMTDRDRREASYERATHGVRNGVIVDASYWRHVDDARATDAGVAQWIIMGNLGGSYEFLREVDRAGRSVWTSDARAAASVLAFETEYEAGIYIARTFPSTTINRDVIQPTAFYPLLADGTPADNKGE